MAAEWFPKSHAEFDDLRRFVAAVIQPEAPSWYTVNQQAEYKLDQINAAMPFIARFKAAFSLYDKDNNGTIKSYELGAVLARFGPSGQNLSPTEMQYLMGQLVGPDGTISIMPFCAFMWRTMSEGFQSEGEDGPGTDGWPSEER